MTLPPARCFACQRNKVAWVRPRVDYCYACLPGGPFPAPSCRACGSANYYSEGLCDSCHPGAPSHLGSCRGCLAWGVYRRHNWQCWSCRWWTTHYPLGECTCCGRTTRVGELGACRLCLVQARMVQRDSGRALHLEAANRWGQQLFFANMALQRRKDARQNPTPPRSVRPPSEKVRPPAWQQLRLLSVVHDPAVMRERAASTDSEMVRYYSDIVRDHGVQHGWSKRQTNDVIRSMRILHALQDTPTTKINATDVLQLSRYDGNVGSTLEVLASAGLLIDDRVSHTERYFASKTALLPEPMRAQLEVWLGVMLDGSNTAPRRRPRDPQTARVHILGIAPILHAWAEAGHQSLAEITHAQVLAALPESGSRRNFAEFGLRSLFTVLKARKLIFTNPTAAMPSTPVRSNVPLPLDTDAVRRALNSPDAASALAVALVAFHALTAKQIQHLKLTDIVDARLALDGRDIPLAGPVVTRLTAWLDHRATTWPGSINPHLFVGIRSAPRLGPVGQQFPWTRTELRPQALREDRILQQIHANGGDIRQICDLFGLSVDAAQRYTNTIAHPDLEHPPAPVPRTRTSE